MKTQITIEQLAEKIGRQVWEKGSLQRIYLNDTGWNTKKMSTKTFIFQDGNGEFQVSCTIDCPSQHDNWIESQEREVIDRISSYIEQAVWEIENPNGSFEQYKIDLEDKLEKQAESKAAKDKSKKLMEISDLNINNVGDFICKHYDIIKEPSGSTIREMNYHSLQLKWQSGFLNEKDDYTPFIHTSAFERRYFPIERKAESFEDKIGIVRVGDSKVEFDDIIKFEYIGKCGNGHKKNGFKATNIPTRVTNKLNEVLEKEKIARIEHLKEQVEYHTAKLNEHIEQFKAENL